VASPRIAHATLKPNPARSVSCSERRHLLCQGEWCLRSDHRQNARWMPVAELEYTKPALIVGASRGTVVPGREPPL
jgi:hypothetical protein